MCLFCVSLFAAFYNFWKRYVKQKNGTSHQRRAVSQCGTKWQVKQKTQNTFQAQQSTLWKLCCVILKVVEIYSCQKLCLLLFKDMQRKKCIDYTSVKQILDKLASSSSPPIHFWQLQSSLLGWSSLKKQRKSGRSATVLAREQETFEEDDVAKASHPLFIQELPHVMILLWKWSQ